MDVLPEAVGFVLEISIEERDFGARAEMAVRHMLEVCLLRY